MAPRGPAAQPLNEVYVVDDTGSKIRCKVCDKENSTIRWLARTSHRQHLVTQQHMSAVAAEEERVATRERNREAAQQEATRTLRLNPVPPSSSRATQPALAKRPAYELEDLYLDHQGNEILFSAGEDPEVHASDARRRLAVEAEMFVQSSGPREQVDDNDETVSSVVEMLRAMGIAPDEEPEADIQAFLNEAANSNWAPYPNKTFFLLDMLDNLPRLRMSDTQLDAEKLRLQTATPTTKHTSAEGNVFHTNPIPAQIAEVSPSRFLLVLRLPLAPLQDIANPLVCPEIVRYPEITRGGIVSESWQADKLTHDVGLHELSPMVIQSGQHFYVNELAQCDDGSYVIPFRWIKRDGVMCGDSFRVSRQPNGSFHVGSFLNVVSVPVAAFRHSFINLESKLGSENIKFIDEQQCLRQNMPHDIRVKAAGRPFYTIWIKLWGDDVSGNRTKQWNKHWNWYFQHAGLPKRLLHQEFFVRFVSTSPHASILEQAKALCEQIQSTRDGYAAYNCELHEEILFRVGILNLPADNPMQAELASHIGLNGNMFCRRCTVGGPQAYKQSDDGYDTLFHPGTKRTPEQTRNATAVQLQHATRGDGKAIIENQRESGVKDVQAEKCIQRAAEELEQFAAGNPTLSDDEKEIHMVAWLKEQREIMNPFFSIIGLDPHRDTPVEALHTILLGIVKYLWALTCTRIAADKRLDELQSRLQSVNVRGLNIPPIRASYLVQYRGSLIGRQFKQLVQVMMYACHDLVPKEYTQAWLAAGNMTARLWYPEIENMKTYIDNLEKEIANFLDAMAVVDPERIIVKPKFHISTHMVEDIPRFGPSLLFSTEMFESYNAVFRYCSILSNHHAPSRDIAINFAGLYRFKHIASGGWWKDKAGQWIRAGPDVRQFFLKTSKVQEYLGWLNPHRIEAGTVRLMPLAKRDIKWNESKAFSAIPLFTTRDSDSSRDTAEPTAVASLGLHAVCQSLDIAKPGDFVVVSNPRDTNAETIIGRLLEIIEVPLKGTEPRPARGAQRAVYATIERFTVGDRHADFRMPTVHKPIEPLVILSDISYLQFTLNVQHDCVRAECKTENTAVEIQDREKTTRTISTVKHDDDSHYIVNLHALHNPHVIRKVFPDNLVSVEMFVSPADRRKLHDELSARLRANIAEKQRIAAAKRAITQATKRAAEGPPADARQDARKKQSRRTGE
ncbi:hypothetical protein BV25DRAFT_1922595 [Artomyces pyxidatus]|uniref:Uncharacterized protein n=1 Tax=Artomyces pyxidatus TaxID=48021 RepID=A0ACB8SFJ8_9AGAM|nr:hypothetical protein BV25DRAFT_1922595 [Artomyces pyxidatus]